MKNTVRLFPEFLPGQASTNDNKPLEPKRIENKHTYQNTQNLFIMKCTWKTLLTSLACAGLLSVSNVFAHSAPQNEQGQPRWIETSWDGESLPTVLHRQPTLTKEQLSEPVTVDNFAKTYPMSTLPIASNQAGSKAQGDNIRFDDFREITHYQDMSLDENLEVEKSFTLDVPDSTYSVSVIGTASTSFFNTDTKREIVLQVHSFTEHLSSGPAYCRDTILVVNEDGEITTAVLQETMINSLMIEQTKDMVVVLTDHSKIGSQNNFVIARLNQITHLITDEKADPKLLSALKRQNVTILTAPLD